MAINAVPVKHKQFAVDEYDQMIAAGVFGEDERLELIEGEIIEMSPIGPAHLAYVNRLNHLLVQQVGALAQVSVQNPIRLPRSEPQPDIVLLRPRPDFYAEALPGPSDVLLLIEVSDTTADYDRTVKIPLYGRNGIVESWLIDLMGNVIEVHLGPSTAGYRIKQTYGPGDHVRLAALPALSVVASDILKSH
jgi:Uma2 family endonuclease